MLMSRIPVHILAAIPCCFIAQKIPPQTVGYLFWGGHLLESKKSGKGTKKHTTNFWKIGRVGMGNTQELLRSDRKAQDPEVLKLGAATLPDPHETVRGCLEGPGGFLGFLSCGLRQAYRHDTKSESRLPNSTVTFFSKHLMSTYYVPGCVPGCQRHTHTVSCVKMTDTDLEYCERDSLLQGHLQDDVTRALIEWRMG